MDLENLSAVELVRWMRSGQVSCRDCLNHFQSRIDIEPYNAFTSARNAAAQATAEHLDQIRGSQQFDNLPLAGLPIAIKDNICTNGITTAAGSRMLETFVPTYDATVVEKLVSAGAIVIGKTLLDEFAMGSSTENPHFGNTRNPWNLDKVPGGSSGGSAVAVAAGLSPVALGSDTGGSIRQPAALCGVSGLKPTYGRVSRYGLMAYGSSLDQIGPIARTIEDVALIMRVINGHDHKDSTSIEHQPSDDLELVSPNDACRSLKVGLCREHFDDGLDPTIAAAIREAVDVYRDLGAEIIDVSLPHTEYAVAAYYLIAPCEASSNLARYDGAHFTQRTSETSLEQMYEQTRADCFGREVRQRIMLGTFALSSGYIDQYYGRASKVRRLIKDDFERVFREVDILLGPTTPTAAFGIGEKTSDPLAMYLADIYTVATNLAGIPAVSIPCGFTESGLPVGMQLQAGHMDDGRLLSVAHAFQQQTDWHRRRPST